MTKQRSLHSSTGRRRFVAGLLAAAAFGLVGRAIYLQVIHDDFLRQQGDARHARSVVAPAYRGMILDRNGEPIAVSSPVDSIWADPAELDKAREQIPLLAQALELDAAELTTNLTTWLQDKRRFVYLKRHLPPNIAQGLVNLGIKGIHRQREYRRYYPEAEVTAHLLGFTNIDDRGQEGVELVFDEQLSGTPGLKRVVRDLRGHTVEELETVREPRPGQDLVLSIDRRIQYYAYRALKSAVLEHRAAGGSLVAVDPHSGEILALVNQPAANPNDRSQRKSALLRNHAVTDVYELGSTLKPFVVGLALEQKLVSPNTVIDTRPGYLRLNRRVVKDIHNYGRLTVSQIIQKSSNVGVSKLALMAGKEKLWRTYAALGFGQPIGIELPGERSGVLSNPKRWNDHTLATHSFGYGLSLTTLQLAQAYAVIAADGLKRPLTIVHRNEALPAAQRVFSARTARQLRKMMEAVVHTGGTAKRAAVNGYQAAGKTGTVHKVINGQYAEDRYLSIFAGMAPADNPRLVMVVLIDDPEGDAYYGGLVAGSVFSDAMGHALRLLNVVPDDPRTGPLGEIMKTAARTGQ